MGYESRLYVVDKTTIQNKDIGKCYAEKIAVFDLSKVPEIVGRMKNYPSTNVYIYADDGNTRILEDDYGDTLKEIPIKDTIKIIGDCMENDDYRRYNPCLQMLKGFDTSQWENLVVLHYGY